VIQQCCTRRLLYTAKIHHLKLTKRNTNNRSLKTRRYPLVKAGVTAIRELKARRHQRAACGHVGPRRGLSHASTGQQRSTEKKPHLITATNQQPQALSCQTLQRSPAAITRVQVKRDTAASVGRRPSLTNRLTSFAGLFCETAASHGKRPSFTNRLSSFEAFL